MRGPSEPRRVQTCPSEAGASKSVVDAGHQRCAAAAAAAEFPRSEASPLVNSA